MTIFSFYLNVKIMGWCLKRLAKHDVNYSRLINSIKLLGLSLKNHSNHIKEEGRRNLL